MTEAERVIKLAQITTHEALFCTEVINYADAELLGKKLDQGTAKAGISSTLRKLEPAKLKVSDLNPFLWALCAKVAKGAKLG